MNDQPPSAVPSTHLGRHAVDVGLYYKNARRSEGLIIMSRSKFIVIKLHVFSQCCFRANSHKFDVYSRLREFHSLKLDTTSWHLGLNWHYSGGIQIHIYERSINISMRQRFYVYCCRDHMRGSRRAAGGRVATAQVQDLCGIIDDGACVLFGAP